ncbi:hypothetical protein [Flavobacterium sp. JAS]|uniref:hypothetical protein n=1 Tax=Flavobacterium sp. JAS TaxID=2897329 RepID=UPI001E431542|nr:hypothetical protein [Flavobacterium sp. JAS]MCD0470482.1 hypothetical protein [Flavobacterium sp. JAS]
MNKIQIENRIAILYLSLQFCTEKIKTFTVGERICINQERFQWLHILSNPEEEPKPVSVQIETKIQEVTRLIAIYNYKPSNQDPFDYQKPETDL